MQIIAIVNEKGGTGKTTTAVNLAAALGRIGRKVLLVDLDGQAASSRWLGVENDDRLAEAMLRGGQLEPLEDVIPGVSLAPASGKLDSVAHDLRPTQGGQLRKVLHALEDQYDYVLIDCPPSLGNRLIGNALLAATHALVPVEPSILALDGLRILLTTLQDVRDGFDHDISLIGVMACRYEARTRLSRLVLGELNRALPGKVFQTVIRETVRVQECPASGMSLLDYAPDSHAAEDYLALAAELDRGGPAGQVPWAADADLAQQNALSEEDRIAVMDFRKQAAVEFGMPSKADASATTEEPPAVEEQAPPEPTEQAEPDQPAQEQAAEELIEEAVEYPGDHEEPQPAAPAEVEQPAAAAVAEADGQDQPRGDREDYFDEMPNIFEPGSLTSAAPDESPTPQNARDDEPPEQEDKAYDESAETARKVKVLGAVGASLLIAAGLVGWYSLRPSRTTSRATASPEVQQAAVSDESPSPAAPAVVEAPKADTVPDTAAGKRPREKETEERYASAQAQPTTRPADGALLPPRVPVKQTNTGENLLARWVRQGPPPRANVAEPAKPVEAEPPAVPQVGPSDFSVTCVMLGSAGGRAMINGRSVSEGDEIDGAKVVRITAQAVELEAAQRRFTLGIDAPPEGPPAEAASESPASKESAVAAD